MVIEGLNMTRNVSQIDGTNGTCLPKPPPSSDVPYAVMALLGVSIIACVCVLLFNAKRNQGNFFKWKLVYRVSVYIALCDLLFYTAQVPVNLLLPPNIKEHPVYRTIISISTLVFMGFAYARIMMSNIVTIGVALLIFRNQPLSLGKRDWKLQVPVFGIPFLVLTALEIWNLLIGENDMCDASELVEFNAYFYVLSCSFFMLILSYIFIWIHVIRMHNRFKAILERQSNINYRRLALNLSLYVLEFLIQFGGNVFVGMWRLFEEPPEMLQSVSVLFVVSGGVLNGIVFFTIRRTSRT